MLEMRGEPRFAGISQSSAAGSMCRRSLLEPFLREQILPHLVRTHAHAAAPGLPLDIFARALIADQGRARAALSRLAEICEDPRRLLLEAMAPVARRLGEWWSEDVCDFFAVSEGMARLHAMLAGMAAPDSEGVKAPAMLLLTAPGETHRFGADMAADLFRREGWRVSRGDGDLAKLKTGAFDAIGVSCASERAAERLPQFLSDIKALAGPRAPPLLLGGALFEAHAERAQNFAVDFVAFDPDSPRRISRTLLQPRAV